MPRTSDKRQRLVKAARRLIHKKGFNETTLSDVAAASGVPLGNVYYYFHTKNDLLTAVAQAQTEEFEARAQGFSRKSTPQQRLLAFLDSVIQSRNNVVRHGCPVGSLCQEMKKRRGVPRDKVVHNLIARAQWVAEQFREMGRRDADELGVWLTGSVQGVILMANALDDPGVISRQIRQMKAWIRAF